MGGGTLDVYRVCEQMARLDVGVATSVLATFLGSDPIFVGATPEQKQTWLTEIADKGILYAYGATEPEAGQRPGRAQDDRDAGADRRRRRPGTGSTAASSGSATAGSPTSTRSWPARPAGRPGSCSTAAPKGSPRTSPRTSTASGCPTPPRCSSTMPSCPPANLVGGVEGPGPHPGPAGLRLHAADGGGLRSRRRLVRARPRHRRTPPRVSRAARRCQTKQGYTHKLIVPHAVRLEAARAYIEYAAARIDAGEGEDGALNTEGAIAQVPGDRGGERWRPTPRSRRTAATATPASTSWRRSSGTSASPRSTKAPPRSWR